MFFWYSATMLAIEAARVIEMRLQLIAHGGASSDEMLLMVTEKIDAMEEARVIMFRDDDPQRVIESYRKVIAANVKRLSV